MKPDINFSSNGFYQQYKGKKLLYKAIAKSIISFFTHTHTHTHTHNQAMNLTVVLLNDARAI